MKMISFAQNFEDVILWRVLKDVNAGRYIDVGAFHPEVDSVTKWFYDQGWSGINMEPVPAMFALFESARPRDINICAAAGAFSGKAEMAFVPGSFGLSSLDVATVQTNVSMPFTLAEVDVRPLREIAEPFAGMDIHFLKIDAEGTEANVLLGMDFNRFRPWVVVVEATEPLSQAKTIEKWESILIDANYRCAYFDGLNEFYVAGEKAELVHQLAVPPNVFDEFELAATVAFRRELEATGSELASKREEAAQLSSQLSATRAELAVTNQTLFTSQFALDAERKSVNDLKSQLDHETAQSAALRGQVQQYEAEIRDQIQSFEVAIRDERRSSEAAIATLSGEMAEVAQAARHAREALAISQGQLQQVLNSRSFRWLGPARRLRRVLLPHRR